MPNCLHPTCRREDLPTAPALPVNVRAPVAHVNPNGEPCPFSPDVETYDLEALTTIVSEDALWNLGELELEVVRPELVIENLGEAAASPTHPPAPPAQSAKSRKKAQRGKAKAEDVDEWNP